MIFVYFLRFTLIIINYLFTKIKWKTLFYGELFYFFWSDMCF